MRHSDICRLIRIRPNPVHTRNTRKNRGLTASATVYPCSPSLALHRGTVPVLIPDPSSVHELWGVHVGIISSSAAVRVPSRLLGPWLGLCEIRHSISFCLLTTTLSSYGPRRVARLCCTLCYRVAIAAFESGGSFLSSYSTSPLFTAYSSELLKESGRLLYTYIHTVGPRLVLVLDISCFPPCCYW